MKSFTSQKKPINHRTKWSELDVITIRNGIRFFSVEELSIRLGRTKASLYSKLQEIGVSCNREDGLVKKNPPKNTFWTEEKFLYVKNQVLKRSISDVAREIGKSEKTVAAKLKREGIEIKELRPYISSVKKPNAWTEKEIKYLIKYAGEKSSIELSKKLNRTNNAIKQKASRLGLILEKNPWSEEQVDMLFDCHNAGMKTKEISEKLGRSIESVRTKMRAYMLPTNHIWKEDDVEKLLRLLKSGMSFSNIAQGLGRTKQAVIKKYNRTRNRNVEKEEQEKSD